MVAAKCAAPPSGRSSRVTEVTTTYFSSIPAAASATRPGSPGSSGSGTPECTAQKRQLRVQRSPMIRKVAVRCEKHSHMFGHLASWQTVCRRPASISSRTRA